MTAGVRCWSLGIRHWDLIGHWEFTVALRRIFAGEQDSSGLWYRGHERRGMDEGAPILPSSLWPEKQHSFLSLP